MTETLLADFHKQNTFQLGQFTLKSGVSSPIYIDLRTLISSPKILENAARAICDLIKAAELEFDYVVGVPYGAIMIATLVSNFLQKPMLLKRKEAKSYGQKKLIEGCFEAGKKALIIEDVVTSGGSVMETVEELRKEDLICEHVFCVLDREQGGLNRLRSEDINLHNIISMSKILDYLVATSVITETRKEEIQKALKSPVPPSSELAENHNSRFIESGLEVCTTAPPLCGISCKASQNGGSDKTDWSLAKRQALFLKNSFNKRLVEIILHKKSNLCLAADFETTEEILSVIEKVKDYICALKIHYDIISNFNKDFVAKLQQLSNDYNFIIFEDRKFADTGKTIQLQLDAGELPISNWADLVTVHSVVGYSSVSALKPIISKQGTRLSSCLLIAELSTENTLTKLEGYAEGTIKIAQENSQLVSGFICQKRCHDDPSFLYWTPGVNLNHTEDGVGQKWRSVEQAIIVDACDIIIVGRGICAAADLATEARRYAQAGWAALSQR